MSIFHTVSVYKQHLQHRSSLQEREVGLSGSLPLASPGSVLTRCLEIWKLIKISKEQNSLKYEMYNKVTWEVLVTE